MKKLLGKIKEKRIYIFSFFILLLIFIPILVVGNEGQVEDEGLKLSNMSKWGDIILINFGSLLIEIGSWILYISGVVFDNLLAITLSIELFNSSFVKVAWSNIRDLANVVFILGMISIAFSMMFNWGNWKKSLISLIVVAFALNFSLFFARVIVDAGNITANVFLSSISVGTDDEGKRFWLAKKFYSNNPDIELRSVSGAFLIALQPEQAMGPSNFILYKNKLKETNSGGEFFFLGFFLLSIMIILAKTLFTAGFMFLGRMVWIIYYMISAPFFFVSTFIPGQQNLWKDKWLIPLLQKSFCVSVYLFFLWLSLMILTTDMLSGADELGADMANDKGKSSGESTTTLFLAVLAIKTIFIVKMLDMGNDLGKKWCEDGKSTLGSILGGASSIATKTPLGGLARTMVGKAGKIGKIGLVQKMQSSGSKTVSFAGDRIALFGKGMQNAKIGGKSYATDQNARIKALRQIEKDMKPELAEKRRKHKMGVLKGDETLKLNKIKSVRNKEGHQKVQELKIKEETLKTQKKEAMATVKSKTGNWKESPLIKTVLEKMAIKGAEKQKSLSPKEKRKWKADFLANAYDSKERDPLLKDRVKTEVEVEAESQKKIIEEKSRSLAGSLKSEDILLADEKGVISTMGKIFAAVNPIGALEAEKNRVSEDQEVTQSAIKTDEKTEEKRVKIRELVKKAEEKTETISNLEDEFDDSIDQGDLAIAMEVKDSLEGIANSMNLSDDMKTVFESMDKNLALLTKVEIAERKYDESVEFNQEDYKAGSEDNKKEYLEKLGNLYGNNESHPEYMELRKAIEGLGEFTGEKLSDELKSKIEKQVGVYKEENDPGEFERKKTQLKRKASSAAKYLKKIIKEELSFDKSIVSSKLDTEIKQQSDLKAKSETNAEVEDKGTAIEMQRGQE